MSSPYNIKSKMYASMGDIDNIDLNVSPKSSKPAMVGRGKTYSGGNSTGLKSDYSISISPKQRNSAGTLHASVADRRKSRNSYLNKRKGREGAANRKDLISKSMFSKVDSVFGEEENDISSKNENSYLKRLLLAPSSASPGGKAPKKLNVDNCRLQRKKKPPKMKLTVPQIDRSKPNSSGTSRTSINKPKLVSPTGARTPEKTIKNKITAPSSRATNKRLQSKAEQNEKRLSADSIDTAPTEGSDSTDNDTLLVNSTGALSIDTTATRPSPAIDYSDVFYSFETVSVEVNFEAPSVERPRKVSFAPKAQVASIADLIIESADASKEFQWEDLFYTEEELSDQRHEAFLEMCGLDEEF